MASDSDYLVKNAKVVFNHFNELLTKKCLISAHFGDRNTSFLTMIVDLDKKNNLIKLDCGPSETVDNHLLESSKVLFRTEVDGIKASFSGKSITKVKTGNDWAFSMPIPDVIFWLQRRQFYRVKIPFSHSSSFCRLNLQLAESDQTEQSISFQLCDLSITGFSFFNIDPKWSEQLQPDTEFHDCNLHLNNGNQALVSFVIKNNIQVRSSSVTLQNRIGCLFINVPTSFETNIQRYMQDIELQQKNIGLN